MVPLARHDFNVCVVMFQKLYFQLSLVQSRVADKLLALDIQTNVRPVSLRDLPIKFPQILRDRATLTGLARIYNEIRGR
jgi:hypothetical protein